MGKLLALDIGSKIIGLAIGDEGLKMAFPRPALIYKRDQILDQIDKIVLEEGIAGIVVGLPITPSGERGESAFRVERFVERFRRRCSLPVTFVDEEHSTDEAREMMGHKKNLKKSGRLDSAAATIILERYFSMLTKV